MKAEAILPLRYPGGKRQLFDFVYHVLEENAFLKCTYIEPYCGGAGLALSLLFNDCVSRIILNDIDRAVYAFWYSVLNRMDELCGLIEKTPVTIDEYRRQREIFKDSEDLLELGFAALYLNRTNRSGILTGGPIGGFSQKSSYKLDCRFNKKNIVNVIRQTASFKDRIELYNLDAMDFLRKIESKRIRRKVLFIDPPYYEKSSRLYTSFYKREDHYKLAKFLTGDIKHTPWLLTYDDADEIRQMYEKRNVPYRRIKIKYSAARKKYETELLFFNKLKIPAGFNADVKSGQAEQAMDE